MFTVVDDDAYLQIWNETNYKTICHRFNFWKKIL